MQVASFTGLKGARWVDGLLLTEHDGGNGYVRVGAFQILDQEYFDDRSDVRAIDLV